MNSSYYYVVKKGSIPGIYKSWTECQEQVNGYPGSIFKKFNNMSDAVNFLHSEDNNNYYEKPKTKETFREKIKTKEIDTFNQDNNQYLNDYTYIFCDGSAIHNNYKSVRCGFGVFVMKPNGDSMSVNKELINTGTNNLAELNALLTALKIIQQTNTLQSCIISDSKYALNCLLVWSQNWIENNWLTSKKTPVENDDVIKSILDIYQILLEKGYTIKFKHINSHQHKPVNINSYEYFLWYGNEMADQLAKTGNIIKEYTDPVIS
jgi:ribonuclease HI